jgi:hypothetical protein
MSIERNDVTRRRELTRNRAQGYMFLDLPDGNLTVDSKRWSRDEWSPLPGNRSINETASKTAQNALSP